jgi:hypothetical protein
MFRPTVSAALLALTAAIALAPGAHAASAPVAQAAGACQVPSDGHGWGPTYVLSLTVKGTSCATGKSLVKAYDACRIKHGGKAGKCPASTKVLGFRCTETRGDAIPTQFDAKVSCTKGSARVTHAYTQFT